MFIKDYLKNNLIFLDGGMGTMLQKNGLKAGELPERFNVSNPEIVTSIHKAYFDAGSNVISTNTFGANVLKYNEKELENIIKSAVQNVKTAREQSKGSQPKWIALDVGPTGRMLAPYGDLSFEDAVNVFKKTVEFGVKYGVDLILIETMTDSYETKAAVIASKECCNLPIFVSNAFGEDGCLMTGANAFSLVTMLEGLGVDAIGANCSFGPKQLMPIIDEYLKHSSTPILVEPNAGLPRVVDGKTVYDVTTKEFAYDVCTLINKGVRIVGGCCGTTPEHIRELVNSAKGLKVAPIEKKNVTAISSYTHAVEFNIEPILIGERINPTGKKKLKEALKNGDIDYVLKEAVTQQEKGVHVLDVNVGLPEINEVQVLTDVVKQVQSIVDLPLQIDTSNVSAMESALRIYNGKPMINSVNGKEESMQAVFPLVKKYGGLVVCLTLDENGIPQTAEGRLEIAKRILAKAKEYGLDKKDLIFDPLALTISADKNSGIETIKAVKLITEELGAKTSLGVSNVSFGLPNRDAINGAFFTMALNSGLSCAIMNPNSMEMMKAYHAFKALNGLDENFLDYIKFTSELPQTVIGGEVQVQEAKSVQEAKTQLQNAIIKGLKERTAVITQELLKTQEPLDIIENEIIPALNIVGKGFENKTVYLPQLLMSAEASKVAFDGIKEKMKNSGVSSKCPIVIATVKGDIHDIGKNIVKLLLENYGFLVYDLGKDVAPEKIAEKVLALNAPIVCLSALMTTTVPSMEQTIKLVRQKAPWCKVLVGGAVLNKDYANQIGADYYAKDAMEAVRCAEEIQENIVKNNEEK
ncbi:MAG: homocysteine S-methyltransferase family protein [Clostridia bacterium]|nr:homocysteine S-methyltransferase family protein [Clostridia bacterium]